MYIFYLQDIVEVEGQIKYCLEKENEHKNISCDKSKFKNKVREFDNIIQDMFSLVQNLVTFAFEKNETHVNTLLNENIFMPVKNCMQKTFV